MSLIIKIFVEPNGKCPTKGKEGDAGFDCYGVGDFQLNAGSSAKIPLGFRYAFFYKSYGELIPTNDFYIEIANRSGFGTKEMVTELARVCDASYRGIPHYSIAKIGGEPTTISHHQKVCQLLLHPFVDPQKVELLVVDTIEELGSTTRGARGFNSSGSF